MTIAAWVPDCRCYNCEVRRRDDQLTADERALVTVIVQDLAASADATGLDALVDRSMPVRLLEILYRIAPDPKGAS